MSARTLTPRGMDCNDLHRRVNEEELYMKSFHYTLSNPFLEGVSPIKKQNRVRVVGHVCATTTLNHIISGGEWGHESISLQELHKFEINIIYMSFCLNRWMEDANEFNYKYGMVNFYGSSECPLEDGFHLFETNIKHVYLKIGKYFEFFYSIKKTNTT